MSHSIPRLRVAAGSVLVALGAVACGGDGTDQARVETSEGAAASQLISVDEFVDFLDTTPSAVLVNVHIPYEGHIDGTDAFVPFDEIGTWDGLPADRDTPIALYCRSGSMSAQATATLVDLGYTNLVDLDGGMNAWTDAGNQLLTNR
jgi:rhodanese-related sulfurtransferase